MTIEWLDSGVGMLMGTPLKSVVARALVCALTGCVAQIPTVNTMPIDKSQALLNGKVQVGMSRADVEKTLGFPQKIERVGPTTFFFYAPNWYYPSFFISSQNPVALANEKVVGIGQSYYETVVADSNKLANSR